MTKRKSKKERDLEEFRQAAPEPDFEIVRRGASVRDDDITSLTDWVRKQDSEEKPRLVVHIVGRMSSHSKWYSLDMLVKRLVAALEATPYRIKTLQFRYGAYWEGSPLDFIGCDKKKTNVSLPKRGMIALTLGPPDLLDMI